MVKLDIVSDPICPWCYIGKAKLEQALAQAGDHPFDIRWRPFRLNPEMPPDGMDRKAYLEAKFGGKERAAAIYDKIRAAGAEAGLDLDFARIGRTPDTLDAHRVIRWARMEGAQGRVVDALFRAYFEQGADISDRKVLLDAAEGAGMDRALVEQLLDSEADREEVIAEDEAAREIGVGGVPTFLIGGKYVIQGAQEPELWTKVIGELLDLQAAQAAGDLEGGDGPAATA